MTDKHTFTFRVSPGTKVKYKVNYSDVSQSFLSKSISFKSCSKSECESVNCKIKEIFHFLLSIYFAMRMNT